jgi:hypothetical protein
MGVTLNSAIRCNNALILWKNIFFSYDFENVFAEGLWFSLFEGLKFERAWSLRLRTENEELTEDILCGLC